MRGSTCAVVLPENYLLAEGVTLSGSGNGNISYENVWKLSDEQQMIVGTHVKGFNTDNYANPSIAAETGLTDLWPGWDVVFDLSSKINTPYGEGNSGRAYVVCGNEWTEGESCYTKDVLNLEDKLELSWSYSKTSLTARTFYSDISITVTLGALTVPSGARVVLSFSSDFENICPTFGTYSYCSSTFTTYTTTSYEADSSFTITFSNLLSPNLDNWDDTDTDSTLKTLLTEVYIYGTNGGLIYECSSTSW